MTEQCKKFLLVTCFMIIPGILYSQDYIIGINLGIGSSGFNDKVTLFASPYDPAYKIGLNLGYSPYISMLTIISGIELEKKSSQQYLNIPLGIKVEVGDKIKFFVDGGAYYSSLLHSDLEEDQSLSEYDLGTFAGIGLEFEIDKKVSALVELQNKFGLKNVLKEEDFDYINGNHFDEYRLYGFYISMSLNRRF